MRAVASLDTSRIKLSGDLDLSTREKLAKALRAAESLDFVTLDLGEVTFLDASALGCFVHLRNHMRQGHVNRVRLVDVQTQHARILRLVDLHQLFDIREIRISRAQISSPHLNAKKGQTASESRFSRG